MIKSYIWNHIAKTKQKKKRKRVALSFNKPASAGIQKNIPTVLIVIVSTSLIIKVIWIKKIRTIVVLTEQQFWWILSYFIWDNSSIASSSSCHATSTDTFDPLSPPHPIVHCFLQVLRATSRICTELLYECLSWSPCLCTSKRRGPQEYITYELVPTSPAVAVNIK